MNQGEPIREWLDRVQQRSLYVGMGVLGLCLAGAFVAREQFFRSYLVAFLLWAGVALGSMALLMLHHLAGGRWGFVIRRQLEAAAATMPLLLILFLPILFGMKDLYPWMRPEVVTGDHYLEHKASYLNLNFFVVRAAIYFGIWILLSTLLNRWSLEQDRSVGARAGAPLRRMQILSAPGLGLYALTVSFAAVDWAMSLEPHWFSTIYGMLFMGGQALAGMAFAVLVASRLVARGALAEVAESRHFHDLGSLLFAFVMIWAYLSFSQFLIIWSGNIPEEIPWYISRTGEGWQTIALVLIIFHFAVPFLLLLSRDIKQRPERLAVLAALISALRLVDLFWVVAPAFHGSTLRVHWLDLALPAGLGGVWLAAFVSILKSRPLVPLHDPQLEEDTAAHSSEAAG
jgi:hypothetical protein